MLREDDKLLKRLELYFDDRQADLAPLQRDPECDHHAPRGHNCRT